MAKQKWKFDMKTTTPAIQNLLLEQAYYALHMPEPISFVWSKDHNITMTHAEAKRIMKDLNIEIPKTILKRNKR
jgi:hypothetical protein